MSIDVPGTDTSAPFEADAPSGEPLVELFGLDTLYSDERAPRRLPAKAAARLAGASFESAGRAALYNIFQ